MARDRGYGSGFNNTGMPRYTPTSVSQGQTGFHIRDNANEWSLNFGGLQLFGVQKGTVQQQQAKTVAQYGGTRPVGQLVRDITGVGYDEKGKFGVDPVGLAMAWTPAKFAKFNRISASLRSASKAADEAFQAGRPMIGGSPMLQGDVIRNLDKGFLPVRRSFEGAFEAISDRIAAAQYGKEISKIMAKNKMQSVPNNLMAAGAGKRDVFLPVSDATPRLAGAQRVLAQGRDPGSLYLSGVPAGGWVKSPNLRARRPITPDWAHTDTGSSNLVKIFDVKTAPEYLRTAREQIKDYFDEAVVRRNLSAGTKPGGEYYFPRPYQGYVNYSASNSRFRGKIHEGGVRFDPAEYQSEVMDFIRAKIAARRQIK